MSTTKETKEKDSDDTEEVRQSPLGTKEHWDTTYDEELVNLHENGVVGDSWFEENEQKILDFLLKNPSEVSKEDDIIDIGCGNGKMLVKLAQNGFTKVTGVDYSEKAIELSKQLLMKNGLDSVMLEVLDVMCEKEALKKEAYTVCLDKGTFDAVTLMSPDPTKFTGIREQYFSNVHHMLRPNGLFILISCGWSMTELLTYTEPLFTLFKRLSSPEFMFGGASGNIVSIAILRKK